MSQNNLITIGSTPTPFAITQSVDGDFVWVVSFLTNETGNTQLDVSDSTFEFKIYDRDGVAVLIDLSIGSGISRPDDYSIRIAIDLEDYTDFTVGCSYPYLLRETTADGTRKPLFKDKFTLTK